MSKSEPVIAAFASGILLGAASGVCIGLCAKYFKKLTFGDNKKKRKKKKNDNAIIENPIDQTMHQVEQLEQVEQIEQVEQVARLEQVKQVEEIEELKQEKIEQINREDIPINIPVETNIHIEKENTKIIKNIDKAPLELRKRFGNKGFVIVSKNLATVNTELNEFIELMRRCELGILDGCKDPIGCSCNFRHKRCRLFMIRIYSDYPDPHFYVPTCSGVIDISPSNKDVQDGTTIHEFVQMFKNKFYERVSDLINYVGYITDPNRSYQFVVDITLIADPYDDYYKYEPADGGSYGEPYQTHQNQSIDSLPITTNINKKSFMAQHKCTISWHQDQFKEAKTNQTHAYDIVAMFLLNAHNITPHALMIGKLRSDVDIKGMTIDQIQEHIVQLSETQVDQKSYCDIGYIIDQRKNIFHRHTEFEYNGRDSRRNIITIRLKYLK